MAFKVNNPLNLLLRVMKSRLPLLFILLLLLACLPVFSRDILLKSPDGQAEIRLRPGKTLASLLSYDVQFHGRSIVRQASVGMELSTPPQADSWTLRKTKRSRHNETWKTVYGEREMVPDQYNAMQLRFRNQDKQQEVIVYLRAYNEGIAYQYEIKDLKDKKPITLKRELSDFTFPGNPSAWVCNTAQGLYSQKKISEITGAVERPLTLQLDDSTYVALGEASLVDFARMKFVKKDHQTLQSRLDGPVTLPSPFQSPWRYLLLGRSEGELLANNYLLLNLNEPSKIRDTSWIVPGKVLREVSLTTTGAYATIDFAARHQLKYILFDAGWYGREDSEASDATAVNLDPARSKGPLDLQSVLAYAKQKDVGVILYVNRRALERQLDTLLPLYQQWGVKGIKFGFVQVGTQQWTSWLHEAIAKAAKYHMLVDVHDEYRPTGFSRTYPNLLTQEGIRGDEETPPAEQTLITLFTRMLAGAGDQTNCYFTDRPDKMGSHAMQLAKAVCLYSPWQFLYWYDRPAKEQEAGKQVNGVLREVPELSFFDQLPTVWQDTKVLEGKIGQYATIARRSKQDWFIGSINGKQERSLVIDCSFLEPGKAYAAKVYTDETDAEAGNQIKIQTISLSHNSKLRYTLPAKSGLTLHISPVNP